MAQYFIFIWPLLEPHSVALDRNSNVRFGGRHSYFAIVPGFGSRPFCSTNFFCPFTSVQETLQHATRYAVSILNCDECTAIIQDVVFGITEGSQLSE